MSYEINFGPWGSIFAVPTAVADRYLKFCTEEQLKVLLLALRQGQGPVDTGRNRGCLPKARTHSPRRKHQKPPKITKAP